MARGSGAALCKWCSAAIDGRVWLPGRDSRQSSLRDVVRRLASGEQGRQVRSECRPVLADTDAGELERRRADDYQQGLVPAAAAKSGRQYDANKSQDAGLSAVQRERDFVQDDSVRQGL